MHKYDITILTDQRYVDPDVIDQSIQNVIKEDTLLKEALERKGLKVHRTNWDDKLFDWSTSKYILFRTTWDYFERFSEFSIWLKEVSKESILINSKELIHWNIDKHYLLDIKDKGIHIPATIFLEAGENRSLDEILSAVSWSEVVLKPAVSGGAFNTYRFTREDTNRYESRFAELIADESLLLQEFQNQIISKGEVAHMVFGGVYSHSVLKKAKKGDYRVQDDFGGTLHDYFPDDDEIQFIQKCVAACPELPLYARVDILWDNEDIPAIGEIELIEPELWFRRNSESADLFAEAFMKMYG